MKITLYKNCCLTKQYVNVLAKGPKVAGNPNSSPFLLYLNSLSKLVIDIDKTYMENSGTLVFDYEFTDTSNIYDYNYMKVEFETSNEVTIVRYCFIDSIRLRNELVYLSYSEDIWHSYSDSIMGFNPCALVSSRLKDEYDDLDLISTGLKLDYNSFNGLNLDTLYDSTVNSKFYFIVEFQFYNLSAQFEPTDMRTLYLLIRNNDRTATTIEDVSSILESLVYYMKSGTIKYFNTTNYYYYNVGKMYLVPSGFNVNYVSSTDVQFYTDNNHNVEICKGFVLQNSLLSINVTEQISIDYKTIGIGTLQHQIPVIYNKLSNTVDVLIRIQTSNFGITITMDCEGQMVDITEDYSLEYPVQSITAAEYKQGLIAKKFREIELGMSIVGTLLGVNTLFATSTSNSWKTFKSAYGGSISSGEGSDASIGMGTADLAIGLNKQMNENFEGVWKASESIFSKGLKLSYMNLALYSTMNGVTGIKYNNLVNSLFGLIIYSKNSNNDKLVKDAINNYGYNVAYVIDNSNFANLKLQDANYFQTLEEPINYNVLEFNGANVYGKFSNNIANALNKILNNGIKIWYKEDFSDDELEVG